MAEDTEARKGLERLAGIVGQLAGVVNGLATPDYIDEQLQRIEGRLEEFQASNPATDTGGSEGGSGDNNNGSESGSA